MLLCTLEVGRNRSNLIEVFKMFHGYASFVVVMLQVYLGIVGNL